MFSIDQQSKIINSVQMMSDTFIQTNISSILRYSTIRHRKMSERCKIVATMQRSILQQLDAVDLQAGSLVSLQDIYRRFLDIESSQKIYEITESLKNAYILRFDHYIIQQKKRLNQITSERIYSLKHNIPYCHILRSQQQPAQQLEKERKLYNIIDQYSQSRVSSFSQQQILKFSQRREVQSEKSRIWKFRYINHLTIERQIQIQKQCMHIFKDINQLEVLSPRALIGMSMLYGFKQKAVECLIAEMSYHSRCYAKKSTNMNKNNHLAVSKELQRFITFINPRFFQFSLFRTNYRLQFAGNQLIEAVILLGLYQSFQHLFPDQLNKQLCSMYMNKRKVTAANQKIEQIVSKQDKKIQACEEVCKQTVEEQQKSQLQNQVEKQPALIQQEICEQFKVLNLIDQMAFMDSTSQNSWYCSSKEKLQNFLNAEEREQVKNRVQQQKKFRRDQLKQLESQLKKELIQQIKQQIGLQIRLRKNECEKMKILVAARREDNYEQIKDQQNIEETIKFYQDQISAYYSLIKQLRRQTYERINQNYANIYREFNQFINQILDSVQRLLSNEQYNFSQQQRKQFRQIQVQFKNLKYQFIEHPIRETLQYLAQDCLSLCKQKIQNQVNQKLRKKIYDEIDKIKDISRDVYNQIKSTNHFRSFMANKDWIIDNPIAIIRKAHRGFEARRLKIASEIATSQKILQSELENVQHTRFETEKTICHKRYDQLRRKLIKMDQLVWLLFIEENSTQLIEYFIWLYKERHDNNYKRVQVLLIYLAYFNYSRLSRIINSHIQQSRLILFKNYLNQITEILQKPCATQNNFQLYCSLFNIFDANMVFHFTPMSIFENMVLVRKQSILLKNSAFQNQKGFCFSADEEQQAYLMRLSTASGLVSRHLNSIKSGSKTYIPVMGNSQLIAIQLFHVAQDKKKISPNLQKIMMTIEDDKCSILSFFYQNQFVSHQSSLFVYHQLKAYYDLIVIIRSIRQHSNQFLQNHLKTRIESLQSEFKSWKKYARQFEIYKKINRNQ